MSEIISKQKAKSSQRFEQIAKSTLEIEIEDLFTATGQYEVTSEKIQLIQFSDAYWTLNIRVSEKCCGKQGSYWYFNLDFTIAEFPEELKRDCFIKFSCDKPKFDSTIPYAPTFGTGPMYSSNDQQKGFTVKVAVLKSSKIRSANTFLAQYESRNQLLSGISGMFGRDYLTDFSFIVKDKEFKVHKSILAATSVVMQSLFTSEYTEKETGECNIDDVEPDIFDAMLRFMYNCAVPKNLDEIAFELFTTAHYYEIESLKNICLENIQNNLSKKNAVEAHALAFKYDLQKLSADVWKIIKRDFLKVFLPENVEPLPPDEVAGILALRETEQAVYKKYTKIEAEEDEDSE